MKISKERIAILGLGYVGNFLTGKLIDWGVDPYMEPTIAEKICPTCHQPVLTSYYFCPNCGTNLQVAPLPTTIMAQTGIYLFSIILPLICFIFITRWPGLKYFRSSDRKTKLIGEVAWTLLILSTTVTFWLVYVWTQGAIKSLNDALNTDLGNFQLY